MYDHSFTDIRVINLDVHRACKRDYPPADLLKCMQKNVVETSVSR